MNSDGPKIDPWGTPVFIDKVIGDNMRGQIFFISIVDISSWPQLCFELILLIILNTVSCSDKLN